MLANILNSRFYLTDYQNQRSFFQAWIKLAANYASQSAAASASLLPVASQTLSNTGHKSQYDSFVCRTQQRRTSMAWWHMRMRPQSSLTCVSHLLCQWSNQMHINLTLKYRQRWWCIAYSIQHSTIDSNWMSPKITARNDRFIYVYCICLKCNLAYWTRSVCLLMPRRKCKCIFNRDLEVSQRYSKYSAWVRQQLKSGMKILYILYLLCEYSNFSKPSPNRRHKSK